MEKGKIVYLSGKITDNENYKEGFASAEKFLIERGYIVLNPAMLDSICPNLSYTEYLRICYSLIDISEIVFMVSGWNDSKGANAELSYAKSLGKKIMYQDYYGRNRRSADEEENEEWNSD